MISQYDLRREALRMAILWVPSTSASAIEVVRIAKAFYEFLLEDPPAPQATSDEGT